jgi:poly(A) polymerase
MKIAGAWLQAKGTQGLMGALTLAGHKAFFVGGCVRNALMGVDVADIDIATDAHPDITMNIATVAGFRVVPTGLDHGTVTVVAGGVPHEVTTFRRDVRTDGRHAVVAFSDTIAEDAARRDFTMNALYAQADGTVIDPLGGLPDLIACRVRFVGDPNVRIAEDYLRILRFFRFYAIYGDASQGIDADGLAACADSSAMLNTLSGERVSAEMRKLLGARDPAPALAAMDQSGVLAQVLPGATARLVPILTHFQESRPVSWLCRLAVIGGQDAAHRLRFTRAEAASLTVICDELGSPAAPDALGWRHGPALATDILLGRAALFEAPPPDGWHADAIRGSQAVFPVAATDLMPELQGPALGEKLRSLQDRWLASGLSLTRDQLLA